MDSGDAGCAEMPGSGVVFFFGVAAAEVGGLVEVLEGGRGRWVEMEVVGVRYTCGPHGVFLSAQNCYEGENGCLF